MRKIVVATVLAASALLVGCSSTPTGSTVDNAPLGISVNSHYVELPDGRTVLCVFERSADSVYSGGPSCDWNNATPKEK